MADLILAGETPDRLLCTTFTAEAAGEMRGRLTALPGPERTPRWVGTRAKMGYVFLDVTAAWL